MRKAKILFISHVPILPKIGGDRVRIWQSLSLLLEIFDVDVIYTAHHDGDYNIKLADSRIGKVWRIPVPRWRRYLQCSAVLINHLPIAVNHFHNRQMQSVINRELPNYDLVFCASPVTARYIPTNFTGQKFLDMTDSLTMNYENKLPHLKGLSKLVWKLNANRMRRYEANCVKSFTATAYIAERDRNYIAANCKRTFIVPNMVDLPTISTKTHEQTLLTNNLNILFVGKMDYEPNIRAAIFFATKVFPLVQKRYPTAHFIIAGMSPTNEVLSLTHTPGIEITGFVESMEPYFKNATLFVAPMLSGSGVQNKILEAMARGCCVLTSPIGAEGIEMLSEGYVVCEINAEQMAEAICGLLADANRRKLIGSTAAKLIQDNFSRDSVREQFHHFIGLVR